MNETADADLLAEFARSNSEEAFAALAARHINLVYSVAFRHTANTHHAQEITQAVFVILARKAGSLAPKTVLSGWLYHTARLTAANFRRAESRRVRREQEAFMQSTLEAGPADPRWRELAPMLDYVMAGLGHADRDAIVLRYFENKNLAEVGTTLGIGERAAQKRVSRALERLRKLFAKRGVTLTAAALAAAVSASSVQAAPAGLVTTVAATAANGTNISATLTTLIKATMKTMTWLKIKFALGVGTAVLLAGGVATVAISQTSGDDNLSAQAIAKQSEDAYAALTSYSDSGKVVTQAAGQNTETTFHIRLQRPSLYRVDWTAQPIGTYTNRGVVWSDGTGDFFVMGAAGQGDAQPQKMQDMRMAIASATGVSTSAASTIPTTFFHGNWGDYLALAASGRATTQKEVDEKIGDIDCRVISCRLDPVKLPNNQGSSGTVTTRFWIGKEDHLIHQTQTTMDGASIVPPPQTDADIKAALEKQNLPATPEAIAALRAEMQASMKLAQSSLKSGKYVFTQTHENISVNQNFSAADFAQDAPTQN